MANVGGIEGMARLLEKLEARKKGAAAADCQVTVSFSAGYALFVHENLEARHPVGQAKFLEQPARQLAAELTGIVRAAVQKGTPLPQALLLAGLRLQREAQLLCPVDTGALRASAATTLETT